MDDKFAVSFFFDFSFISRKELYVVICVIMFY